MYRRALRPELWYTERRRRTAMTKAAAQRVFYDSAVPPWWTAGAIRNTWTASCTATEEAAAAAAAVVSHRIPPPDGTAPIVGQRSLPRYCTRRVARSQPARPARRRTPTAIVRRRRVGGVAGGCTWRPVLQHRRNRPWRTVRRRY